VNDTEARVVAQLVNELLSAGLASSSIGIICLYKAQCDAVNDAVRAAVTEFDTSAVQISTVDAFQGAERDVIIVSCCRTEKLGFIVSSRRLNVALSRARHHLIVVGHRDTLRGNPVWKSVIDTAAKTPGGIRGIGRRPLLLPSM
jgi:superfamily I DNA and/or RNA helicase